MIDYESAASTDTIEVTTAAGTMTLRPVPMRRLPSANLRDWLSFQGAHVPGGELAEQDITRIAALMRRHRTEALTDGARFYTIAGSRLAYCSPAAIV